MAMAYSSSGKAVYLERAPRLYTATWPGRDPESSRSSKRTGLPRKLGDRVHFELEARDDKSANLDHGAGREVALEVFCHNLSDLVLVIHVGHKYVRYNDIAKRRPGCVQDLLDVFHDKAGLGLHVLGWMKIFKDVRMGMVQRKGGASGHKQQVGTPPDLHSGRKGH